MELTLTTQQKTKVGSCEVVVIRRIENGLELLVKEKNAEKLVLVKFNREVELGGNRWLVRYIAWAPSSPVQLPVGTPLRMALLESL